PCESPQSGLPTSDIKLTDPKERSMKRSILTGICLATLLATALFPRPVAMKSLRATKLKFAISFPASASADALDGRLLLLISTNDPKEPRLQISEDLSTQQVFGINVDGWKAGQPSIVDAGAFGYPVRSLADVPPGEYWVQALLHRYETFHRADGQTVKLPM